MDQYAGVAFAALTEDDRNVILGIAQTVDAVWVAGYLERLDDKLDGIDSWKLARLTPDQQQALTSLRQASRQVREAANSEARETWQSKLAAQEAERTQQTRSAQTATEAALKIREKAVWLAQHPDQDAATFERIWPDLLASINASSRERYVEDRLAAKRGGAV